jgi:hypothetical protein
MPAEASGRYEPDLNEQKYNPGRKYDGVYVDQRAGELCMEYASQEVSPRKANEDGGNNSERHSGKKFIVQASVYGESCSCGHDVIYRNPFPGPQLSGDRCPAG